MGPKRKMLQFVTHGADGCHGDTRAGKGWLVLQRKYFFENAGVPPEEMNNILEELDRDGKIYLFALGVDDLDNIVLRVPED